MEALSALEVTPEPSDDVFIELLRTNSFLVKPTVQMADEPDLDSAMDPRKAAVYTTDRQAGRCVPPTDLAVGEGWRMNA